MAMEITNNYSSYAAQGMADNTKKRAEKTSEPVKTNNTESISDYLSKLQKQVPYMTLEVGSGLSMAKDNKVNTLTVNPKLLEKMQNDPEKAKEYTQRLKDIENAQKFVDGYMKAKGSKTKFSHWYVDENGNYSHIAYYEHDNTFYKKLSEKSRENIEKHIEKTVSDTKHTVMKRSACCDIFYQNIHFLFVLCSLSRQLSGSVSDQGRYASSNSGWFR